MNKQNLAGLAHNSPDDEKGLLNSLMASEKCLAEFTADFNGSANAFADGRHHLIFRAIQELAEAGAPLDHTAVERLLHAQRKLEDAGGASYLLEIANGPGNEFSIRTFAPHVMDCYFLRCAIQTAARITSSAQEGNVDVTLNLAERGLASLAGLRVGTESTGIREAVESFISEVEGLRNGGGDPGISTGIGMLDARLGGLHKGQVIVIAGRPGDGKTSLAMQIAENAAVTQKRPVGVISMEMTTKELVARMIKGRAGIGFEEEHHPESNSAQQIRSLADAASEIAQAPLQVCDKGSLNMYDIRAQARIWKQRDRIELLVVDYVGLICGDPAASACERISAITAELKRLAKELGIPVIALSQLNRAASKDGRAPDLHDLRDSGSLEQDADIVLMLHPRSHGKSKSGSEAYSILIRKNRHRGCGEVEVRFNKSLTRFENDL